MQPFDRADRPVLDLTTRSSGIDALRAVAALMVFFYHFQVIGYGTLPGPLAAISERGGVGVFLFFVISGYVLYRPLIGVLVSPRSYAIRRFRRIYPAYVVALVATALLLGRPFDARYLFFLQTVTFNDEPDLMVVSWTLQIEVIFYLLLPIAAAALLRVRAKTTLLICVAAVWFAAATLIDPDMAKTGPWMILWLGWTFAIGMAAATIRTDRGRWAWPIGLLLLALGLSADTGVPVLVASGAAFLILAARNWTAPPWLRASGAYLSYPVYLWHVTILELVMHVSGRIIVAISLTLLVSALSWFLVERPFLHKIDQRLWHRLRHARI